MALPDLSMIIYSGEFGLEVEDDTHGSLEVQPEGVP
jgi:hypothetical protein